MRFVIYVDRHNKNNTTLKQLDVVNKPNFLVCRSDQKMGGAGAVARTTKERFRPVPLPSPVLLPTPHALVSSET